MPTTDTIMQFHRLRDFGVIDFHREPQNRVNRQFFQELGEAITAAEDAQVRSLLIRSTGEDFSRGGDFREWPTLSSHAERRQRFAFSNGVLNRLESLPIPTIAAVHGCAFGGGFELALHTDLIVASSSARFRFPEATVAVPPLAGGLQRVAERAGRATALRLVMLSEEISAVEALRLNLIADIAADDRLRAVTEELAQKLAHGPTRAHAATKVLLAAWSAGGVAGADAQLVETVSTVLATQDVADGVAAATEALEQGTARPALRFSGR